MKKNRLYFMFAALFVSAAVLFSCQKEEVVSLEDGVMLKALTIANYEAASAGCEDDCIEPGSSTLYPVSDMATLSVGINTKSVSYIAYNTETDFVVEVTYAITAGPSDAKAIITIDIDGDQVEYKVVNSGSTVSHTVPLAEDWAGCDEIAFSIVEKALGVPITFNESYALIPVCTEVSLEIGDAYQGGIIAYILQPGDPGYVANETHGIIAEPSDQSAGYVKWNEWDLDFFDPATGATGTALGTGQANTTAIVNKQGAGSYAAQLCNDLVLGGYSDWYLPSRDELNKLYLNRAAVGGFIINYYWSSTEIDDTGAWVQYFGIPPLNYYFLKLATARVRAVRAF
jgi:hypothetical protein